MNNTITAVPGVRVGHWSDHDAMTGCTAVVFPEPNVAAVDIRGGAPGSRETALLEPGMRVEQIQAISLSGGSAFGLSSADGVVQGLIADDRGHMTPGGRVPIVPAAVIFDLVPGGPQVRPGPKEGLAAYAAATDDPVEMGSVGVGTGATVSIWRGLEHLRPGGVGSAVREFEGATVGALVVLNPAGDIFSLEGESLTGGSHEPGPSPFLMEFGVNTTLVVLATDAELTRNELSRLAVRSHDAMAVCVRPSHTRFDGDVVFAISCGQRTADVDALAEAAFGATASAIEAAMSASAS